jgi:hypothetical protein
MGDSKIAARFYRPPRRPGPPLTLQPSPKMMSAGGLFPLPDNSTGIHESSNVLLRTSCRLDRLYRGCRRLLECPPTVFWLQWPPDITTNVISDATPKGTITNSDLKLAGLVLLWLMMEHACGPLAEKCIASFSNNSPTISWVQQMACCSSLVAEQLIRVLALRFNLQKVCLITMLHIAGDQNSMTDIPSRSFGSEHKWHFKSEHDLLNFFNFNFTLPTQNSWTVCHPPPQ